MEYVHDTALPLSQQGTSDVHPSPGPVNTEASIRFLCPICHASYAQRQGAWRHIRTVHNPKPCFLCEFKWARPYEYRNHLVKWHPDVDPDLILGKAPGSRRRATIHTEYLPQQLPVSPPVVEQDQQNSAESQPYPSAPPSPAGARVTSVCPPAVSSVYYNSRPVYAEQTVTMDEHEYAHGSEFFDADYPLAMLLSTEERAEPMNNLDISVQDGQFRLPSVLPDGSTATHNPETAPIPALSPLVGENYGAPFSENPPIGSFGPTLYSPLSHADIEANFNAIFANST